MCQHDAVPDLTIRAGRIVCPASGIDGPGTVEIHDGCIVSVETSRDPWSGSSPPNERRCLDFPHSTVLPGLVDLHAHPARSGSKFGVAPDSFMLSRGVTTVQSQGDAGACGIDDYAAHTIEPSATRVLLAINLARVGESTQAGCFENLADADVEQCVSAVEQHPGVVRAVSVNASHQTCGQTDPREILRRGIQVAERCRLPILYGMRRPEDWPVDEQMQMLRPGDVVTYCLRCVPYGIVDDGRVLSCVKAARERGVLFDVGHGMASFSFEVAMAAIEDKFEPDTISTDLYRRHIGSDPQHDLPLVMSKLQAAGMSESAVFAAATCRPAEILGLDPLPGTLKPGSCADLVVLDVTPDCVLSDVHGREAAGRRWLPRLTVRAGRIVEPDPEP